MSTPDPLSRLFAALQSDTLENNCPTPFIPKHQPHIAKLVGILASMSNRTILLCTFLSLLTLGCEQFRRPQKSGATEIVGQVVDSDTLEPIEGAYVMATYDLQHVPYDYACARSLGVFSDKDGNYRFPIEKSDLYPSGYPHQVFAAKSGYFYSAFATDRSVDSSAASWVIDTRTRVYLAKQDYLNPKRGFNTYHANCYQSRNRKDAVASVEFQKIELEELRKLGTRAAILDSTVERIRALQLLPSIGGEYPNPTRRVYGPDYSPAIDPIDAPPDLLPPPDAVAKEQAAAAKRRLGIECGMRMNEPLECCVSFVDGTRFPEVSDRVRQAGIKTTIDANKKLICGTREAADSVVRISSENK